MRDPVHRAFLSFNFLGGSFKGTSTSPAISGLNRVRLSNESPTTVGVPPCLSAGLNARARLSVPNKEYKPLDGSVAGACLLAGAGLCIIVAHAKHYLAYTLTAAFGGGGGEGG